MGLGEFMDRKASEAREVIGAGRWYEDVDTGQRFKVLWVGAQVLRVADEHGNVRTLNRLMCEASFKEVSQ